MEAPQLPPADIEATQPPPGPRLVRTSTGDAMQLKNGLLIGRDVDTCGLILVDEGRAGSDQRVSRRHAEICVENGHFVLVDKGSTRGTTVNAVRMGQKHFLAAGDLLAFGSNEEDVYDTFEFRVEGLAHRPPPPPPPHSNHLSNSEKNYGRRVVETLREQYEAANGALIANDIDGIFKSAGRAVSGLRRALDDYNLRDETARRDVGRRGHAHEANTNGPRRYRGMDDGDGGPQQQRRRFEEHRGSGGGANMEGGHRVQHHQRHDQHYHQRHGSVGIHKGNRGGNRGGKPKHKRTVVLEH
jgi:hypothetical protein